MTHFRPMKESEGTFDEWKDVPERCHHIVPLSNLPCGHPVQMQTWESNDGAYEDHKFRCLGGGHVWWIDGIDS
jgi:hypothetical protein